LHTKVRKPLENNRSNEQSRTPSDIGRRMTVPRRRCRPIGRHRGKNPSPSNAYGPRDETAIYRFLGGSPGGVFLRLIFVSLIVGAFLMWLDIRPEDIFRGIIQLVDRIWSLGFDAIREIAKYILAEPRSSFPSGWCCGS